MSIMSFSFFMVKGKYCVTYPRGVNLSKSLNALLEIFSFKCLKLGVKKIQNFRDAHYFNFFIV